MNSNMDTKQKLEKNRTGYLINLRPVVLLIITTFLIYASSLTHQFIPFLDDSAYLLANAAAHGFSVQNIHSAFAGYFVGNYAPLHIISYMADYTIWGLNPSGYILTNILLHTANGILFYYFLLRSNLTKTIALFSSLVFLLHPVQVESVAWVSQRKTVLAMFFFLAAIHFYISYTNDDKKREQLIHYVLSLAAFMCALLSKSVTVILPLVLILHDFAYRTKNNKALFLKDKVPYAILAIFGSVLAYISQDPSSGGGRDTYYGGSPWTTFLTMMTVILKYIQILFWPSNLGIKYFIPVRDGVDAVLLFSIFVVIILSLTGYYLYISYRHLFCWYAIFFAGLLPVSQIIPIVTLINDRYLYFPLIGIAPFICSLISLSMKKVFPGKQYTLLLACIPLAILAFIAFERTSVWNDSVTALEDIVKKTPDDIIAWTFLTNEYLKRSDVDNLLRSSQVLLSHHNDNKHGLKMAAIACLNKNYILEARAYMERYVTAYPNDAEACYLLAETYPGEERQQIESTCRGSNK
jgi:hypothetical protein